MKKAVILILHTRPEQANILIKQLLVDREIDIFVHINKREEDKVLPYLIKNERVLINKNNVVVHWGSDGLLKAVLNTYRMIISQNVNYEYVLMCTGSDLLVKADLDDFLFAHKGEAFIDCINDDPDKIDKWRRAFLLHKWPKFYLHRIDRKYNPIRIARSLRMRLFSMFPGLQKKEITYDVNSVHFYYSFVWHAFPFEIIKYIIDFLDENKTFLEIYEGAFMSDESFFATIVMMSPYKDRIKFSNGRSKSITYNKHAVNNHPPILTTSDIPDIDNNEMAYFARKFDFNVDRNVIDYYLNKTGVFEEGTD